MAALCVRTGQSADWKWLRLRKLWYCWVLTQPAGWLWLRKLLLDGSTVPSDRWWLRKLRIDGTVGWVWKRVSWLYVIEKAADRWHCWLGLEKSAEWTWLGKLRTDGTVGLGLEKSADCPWLRKLRIDGTVGLGLEKPADLTWLRKLRIDGAVGWVWKSQLIEKAHSFDDRFDVNLQTVGVFYKIKS